MATINRLIFAFNVLIAIVLLYLIFGYKMTQPALGAWEYKDVVAVLLTVVTIVIGAVGVVLALAAIWGYQRMADHAAEKAAEASRKAAQDYLLSDEFWARVKTIVLEQIENNMDSIGKARALVTAESESEAPPAQDTKWKD